MSSFKKIFIWSTAFLLLLILCLHLLITYRSKALVSRVVDELSGGNYTAKTDEVSFQYFPAGISISGLSVQPTADTGKLFYIKSKQIDLQLSSIVALLVDKKMGVSLLHVQDPEIVVLGKSDSTDEKKSLPESIREIQQGLFNTFSLLKVKDASIKNGSIRVQIDPRPERYFAINHVQLDLKNIVLEPDADNDGIPEFDGSVIIGLKNPDIHFSNPSLELQLGMLKASSANHALVIDSMRFRYAKGNEQVDTINLQKIKINHLNWNKFLKEGNFELDSVIVATGKTTLNFFQQDQPEQNDSANKNNGLYMGPSFLVHHLSVSNISYKLTTQEWIQSREDKMEVNFKGDSLWLKDLSITSGKKPAVDVEALRINFTNYSDANEQKTYAASLGAIEVSNNTLVLKNYSIQALQGSKFSKGNKVVLPELRLQGYSLEDLFLRRLIADKLVINKPEVVIDILQQKRAGPKKEINKEVQEFLADFSKKVSLNEVEVKDASLILRPKKIPGDDIVISGLSINVDGRRALAADSITDILQAVTKFSTEGFRIKSRDMDLVVSEMKMLKDRGLYFGTVQGKFGSNANVNLRGVTILNRNFSFDVTSENGLHVSDLIVEGGTVDVSLNAEGSTKKAGMNLPAVITADHVQLRNIIFRLQQEGKVGAGSALDISATNLSLANGAATWDKLFITGDKNEAIIGEANFKAGTMTIEQPGSISLNNARGNLYLKHAQIHFETQKLLLGVSLSSTDIPELKIKQLMMQQPNIEIEVYQPDSSIVVEQKTSTENKKNISLETLQLDDASIQLKMYKKNKEELINARTFQGNVLMHDLSMVPDEYAPAVRIASILFETNKVETAIVKEFFTPGSLHLKASNLLADLGAKRVTMQVDSLRLTDISQQFFGKKADTVHLHLGELGIADFPFSNTDSLPWKSILLNKKWWTNGSSIRYHTPTELLTIDGLHMKNDKRLSFVFDSLLWHPRLSREDFWKSEPYEKDHLRVWLGKTSSDQLKWKIDGELPEIAMPKLIVQNLNVLAQRDKTRPEDTLTYRPLLARQISNIGIPLRIDTLQLHNGQITYNEIVQKTKLPSAILFDQLQGSIYHIKTHDIEENDSLFITLNAKLYGKGAMRLQFRQSYSDSLQGFWLRTRMGSFDMQEMNAMLLPQLGLRIKSGDVDSLNMLVQGNKYFAYGTMDIRYQNFKVGLVGKSGSEKYFLSGVKNWLANVVLRSHDNGKSNMLLKQRVQKRGQFNYWGKIAIEGLLSNIGLKSNRAERKSLQKQKRIYQMPNDYMEIP